MIASQLTVLSCIELHMTGCVCGGGGGGGLEGPPFRWKEFWTLVSLKCYFIFISTENISALLDGLEDELFDDFWGRAPRAVFYMEL